MSAREDITHPGIVENVTESSVFVKILAMSACASCHAKGMCNLAEMEEKVVEVRKEPGQEFRGGEKVTITMRRSQGSKAVMLGYVVPFLVMVGMLALVLTLSGNEGLAGLSAILILVPYYWLLYVYRNKLKRSFSFRIE